MRKNNVVNTKCWGQVMVGGSIALALAACDGRSDKGAVTASTSSLVQVSSAVSSVVAASSVSSVADSMMDYSQLRKTQLSGKGLVLADAAQLEQHIKNGLRLYLSSQYRRNDCYGFYGGSSSFRALPISDFSSQSNQSSPLLTSSSTSNLVQSAVSHSASSGGLISAPSSGEGSHGWQSSVIYDYCYYPALGSTSTSQIVLSSAVAASSAAASHSGNFTQTNTHVTGIDEADFAKYDGQHWFVGVNGQNAGIDIYEVNPNAASLTAVGRLPAPNGRYFQDLYLVQENKATTGLALLQNDSYGYSYLPAGGYWGTSYPVNGVTKIEMADVSSPSHPAWSGSIAIDGSLINSRRVGNTLYLVTRYEPWLDNVQFDYQDLTLRAKNEERLAAASLDDLLPKVTIGKSSTLLAPDCYVQQGLSEADGYRSLVYITSIDMASQQVLSSRCVNTAVDGMSMTGDSLYLTASRYDYAAYHSQTVIHKFTTQDSEVDYVASGDVWGSLVGQSDAAFRMDEYQGDLRVVTSYGNQHKLFILAQQGDELSVVSELPNSARPDAIGKPNENIYAVRFNGEQAQIVTFRQTDPLYTLDLSNRLDPKISGQLEILGFAQYIHPINDDYVFTVGRDTDASGRDIGMKVALYDVSGADPVEVQSHRYQGSWFYSAASTDLRALSILQLDSDRTRFVVPFVKNNYSYLGGVSGFLLFEVTQKIGQLPDLKAAGVKITQDSRVYVSSPSQGSQSSHGFSTDGGYLYADRQRSVLHDDAVFTTENGKVWGDSWQTLTGASAVKQEQSLRCEQLNASASVSIVVGVEQNYACNAKVTLTNPLTGKVTTLRGQADTHLRCHYSAKIDSATSYQVKATLGGFPAQEQIVTPNQCLSNLEPVNFSFQ